MPTADVDLAIFAKVRALHDRTDIPGEKAAAAGRMEALARKAGMTTAEAVSKLDEEAAQRASGIDWSAFAEGFWKAEAAADAPEASCRRWGLPIYDPNKVEPWHDVAEHCLQLDWIIPKAHGGKFLTKDERARMKVLARHYGSVTNATADWLETVLARIEAARQSWRDQGKGGVRPDKSATESDIEKAGQIIAAAKRREASNLDAEEAPRPGPRNFFEDLFNSPEFKARDAARERERAERRAAALAEYGSEDAVFADTEREVALRKACDPLTVWDQRPRWRGCYTLAGWGDMDGKDTMPASVREAVAQGWSYPETVAAAWAEYEAAEALDSARYAFDPNYSPHQWVRARGYVLEDALDTMPARSLRDLRARMSWLEYLSKLGVQWAHAADLVRYATLRADIERMGARLREQDAVPVQDGQDGEGAAPTARPVGSPDPVDQSTVQSGHPLSAPDLGRSNAGVQSGHPSPTAPEFHEEVVKPDLGPAAVQDGQAWKYPPGGHFARRTNADKRRDVLALLNDRAGETGTAPLTDREIARRAGVSPTTVGTIRRAQAARAVSP